MTFLAGLPSYMIVGAALYVVAELQSRWIALALCAVLFAWLLVSLRREARQR